MTPPKRVRDGVPRTIVGGRIYLDGKDHHGDDLRVSRIAIPGTKLVRLLCLDTQTAETSPVLDVAGAQELIAALNQFIEDTEEVHPIAFFRFGRIEDDDD